MTHDGSTTIAFRTARVADGGAIWTLVRDSGVLDLNSAYMYLLLARDFGNTCVVAEQDNGLLGFVTGYRRPQHPETLFLWQVGIAEAGRGQGLGKRLVAAFLRAPGAAGATMLETTISPSNAASKGLFSAIARDLDTSIQVSDCFRETDFPQGGHEAEELYRIGPFDAQRIEQLDY